MAIVLLHRVWCVRLLSALPDLWRKGLLALVKGATNSDGSQNEASQQSSKLVSSHQCTKHSCNPTLHSATLLLIAPVLVKLDPPKCFGSSRSLPGRHIRVETSCGPSASNAWHTRVRQAL